MIGLNKNYFFAKTSKIKLRFIICFFMILGAFVYIEKNTLFYSYTTLCDRELDSDNMFNYVRDGMKWVSTENSSIQLSDLNLREMSDVEISLSEGIVEDANVDLFKVKQGKVYLSKENQSVKDTKRFFFIWI